MLRSLEQERARYAWECIQRVKEERDIDLEGRYKSYARRASAHIQINGLGNALAFYKSKFEADLKKKGGSDLSAEKKAYMLLYKHIDGWKKEIRGNKDLLEWILDEKTSSLEVFRATKEVIALLNWIRRFAEAELREKEEGT